MDGSGQPNGILKERAVEPLMAAFGQHKTAEQSRLFLETGLRLAVVAGLTAVQTNDPASLDIYTTLCQENRLPCRVLLTPLQTELNSITPRALRFVDEHGLTDGSSGASRLSAERVKIFSDGSLGAETAAICSEDGMKGILVHTSSDLVQQIADAMDADMRLEIHAIGDAAAKQVLDAMEAAKQISSKPLIRPVLTHCQVLGADLLPRMMRDLQVIANVQPSFVPTDMRWIGAKLSAAQEAYAYAWHTLLEAGIMVAGGSDAPIESCSPFTGMYDAIHRSNAHRVTGQAAVYRPEECLSFADALWLYTRGAAYAAGYEDQMGSLQAGCLADLVIVDKACLSDHALLHGLKPSLVMVGGQISQICSSSSSAVAVEKECAASRHACVVENGNGLSSGMVGANLPGKAGQPLPLRKGYCPCCLPEYCFA